MKHYKYTILIIRIVVSVMAFIAFSIENGALKSEIIETTLSSFPIPRGIRESLYIAIFIASFMLSTSLTKRISSVEGEKVLNRNIFGKWIILMNKFGNVFVTLSREHYEARLLDIKKPEIDLDANILFVAVNSPDDLLPYREKLTEYFKMTGRNKTKLIIRMKKSFIIDRFLLWGIMDEFKETWSTALATHDKWMSDFSTHALREFAHFRQSQFLCWLLWGPSIPSCDCQSWMRVKNGIQAASEVWQCGFGDENNSIFLLGARNRFAGIPKGRVTMLQDTSVRAVSPYSPDLAVGRIFSPEGIRSQAERMYVEILNKPDQSICDPKSARYDNYYTAYIWVMLICLRVSDSGKLDFLLSRSDGFGQSPTQVNRKILDNMLPYFVHANIYDEYIESNAIDMLAAQAVASLSDVLSNEKLRSQSPIFLYVGAVDDSIHSKECLAEKCDARKNIKTTLFSVVNHHNNSAATEKIDLLERGDLTEKRSAPNYDSDLQKLLDTDFTPCSFPELFQSFYNAHLQ